MSKRLSKYIDGIDGTKLAVDVYIPDVCDNKIPLLLKAGIENRRRHYESDKEAIEEFVGAGYAVAVVEVRGCGASYGTFDGFFGRLDGKDIACVATALSKEEWCNGKVGTFGGSNYGMSQELFAMEQADCHMAAIPCDCSMDFYDQDFPNGASALPEIAGKAEPPQTAVESGDTMLDNVPVDEDSDKSMLKEALKCHERNQPFLAQHIKNMYRDDVHPYLGYRPNIDIPAWERMDDIRYGHVKMWSVGGWFDPGCTNKIIEFKSWGGKLLIGPWFHCGIYRDMANDFPNSSYDWKNEHLRFFDKYLKGIDNSADSEPPIIYYTVGDEGREWKLEDDFPVSGTEFTRLYLTEAGKLSETPVRKGCIEYKVREDINYYGPFMRMGKNYIKDEASEDAKSIVFTSETLPGDVELTGIPSIDIYVASSFKDGNFIAVLEEVKPDGTSLFITDGAIRASHAKVFPDKTYESLGIPYHRGFREDCVRLDPEKPIRLSFHLEAVSKIIKKGSRLRVAISCGGSGYQQPEGFPEEMPVIKLYLGDEFPSYITLPVIAPCVTVYRSDGNTVYVFKKDIYIENSKRFVKYPCLQVFPEGKNTMIYRTASFDARVSINNGKSKLTIDLDDIRFEAEEKLPDRYVFTSGDIEIPLPKRPWGYYPKNTRKVYVATVPVGFGVKDNYNPLQRSTFDLFISIAGSEENGGDRSLRPCVVNIHGFGGNHDQFENNTEMYIKAGCIVASVDYRPTPPDTWAESCMDVRGCIRYLKAHHEELGIDPERMAVTGGSMGGYLTGMIAAVNGNKEFEGDIGGNTDMDSSVKVACAGFGPMDLFGFGDDSAEIWPARPEKVAASDGPFAPVASMLGYIGPGKGMADIKANMFNADPKYAALRKKAEAASPITYVNPDSAPLCLIHGIFDCGIQVPFGQSVRMFKAYSRVGVKSLLLCNTDCEYGEDPEVKKAAVEFVLNRL